ncbi:Pvc16 family protein [Streptomyces sp. NPDC058155]|uniref:Pvc16 family protein n=1 Tax=Streptomyces sp. NPDC058155 TaxID=3346359 RepID=UPI0036EA4783
MSNALALAHVTQALALLLESNLGPEIDMAVKVEPRKPPADPPTEPTISVFLYQVTPNTSLRNNDLPTRAADGTLVKRPAAALDLHFLITAYGDETALVGQRLIGSVVRALHEIPILPKDIIELAGERPYLAGSDLAESAQRVRFTPTVMDIDETSKLWGMLHQTPYSLSVVYLAALVLIDGRETPAARKPVERPDVRVLPFGAPGAPVPPGAGAEGDVRPAGAVPEDSAQGDAGETRPATAQKDSKTPAKAVAKTEARKTAAKAPARARKSTARTGRQAQPKPRKSAPRRPSGDDDGES